MQPSQYPRIAQTFIQRRPNVLDVGPTLFKVIQMFCVHWDEPVSVSSQVPNSRPNTQAVQHALAFCK